VPVSIFSQDRVRIVISQNNTNITQTGGIIQTNIPGAQDKLHGLQAGQFVELEVGDTGCYIQADKPVGVCSFLSSQTSWFAQCWVPAIEQTVFSAQIAPFITDNYFPAYPPPEHYALVCTSTGTKENTKVSIGGAPPTDLTGGNWIDNPAANMSFYTMPLDNDTASYTFTNQAGLIILCYAFGHGFSYYYLAGSATRNLDVAFYVNDIHYQELDAEFFCINNFRFRAEVENLGVAIDSIKWYLNNVEEIVSNPYLWDKTLAGNNYVVKLMVYPNGREPRVLEGNLHVNPHVTATPVPAPGGAVNIADTCAKIGTQLTLIATPANGYDFVNWTNGATVLGTNETLTVTVSEDLNLNANFKSNAPNTVLITLLANPTKGGTVSGGGEHTIGEYVTITATANTDYRFINWTEGGIEVSTDSVYRFTATEDHVLTAHFVKIVCIEITINNDDYGKIGDGIETDCYNEGDTIIIEAIPKDCYRFRNWSVNGVPPVNSADNPYMLIVTEAITLTAHFYALDFDTYTHIFWNNTFMLDRKKLADDGYEVTGCKWFKDGLEETDTRTVNEFSYSLGPKATDLFDFETAIYKWQIHAKNYGALCSSNKVMDNSESGDNKKSSANNLVVYPNPVFSGGLLTITGTENDTPITVYNALGFCMGNYLSKEDITTITLNFPSGVYWIRNGNKITKAVIIK